MAKRHTVEAQKRARRLLAASVSLIAVLALASCSSDARRPYDNPGIASLDDLSIASLRERRFDSTIVIGARIDSLPHKAFMASYESEGLRVYARIDLPATSQPTDGFPVVVFVHGWIGIEDAPLMDFYVAGDTNYGEMISSYVDAGFVVITPGWRGHGTVDGVAADGIAFMRAWDNGSYLSPVFYAMDVLNLIEGLASVDIIDTDNVNLVAHSQGGDVALIALAVAGEGSRIRTRINAASIWAGTFPPRFVQLETYWPMQSTPAAFMSGDGTWTGTAIGQDGSSNGQFVFGYPSDWIETIDRSEWTWQNDVWSVATVPDSIEKKLEEMYSAINDNVADIGDASYTLMVEDGASYSVAHDPRIINAMNAIDAFNMERLLTETIVLHTSDRDFYSIPEWNTDLCRRINAADGVCHHFLYPGNTHALRISKHSWFPGNHREPGFMTALARDIALFQGADPRLIDFP